MSEVALTLRDAQRSIHGQVHGSDAERIMAALSADPETIVELEHALRRFRSDESEHGPFGHWRPGDCEEPWDAGVYVIDLAARLIAGESTYFQPLSLGAIAFADRHGATDLMVSYHLADHWEITSGIDDWQGLAQGRREEFAGKPRIDAREVLFNKFYQYAVEMCLRAAADGQANPIVSIHRNWLLTPRDDLAGQAPRDVLVADRHHLDMDLQHREFQWGESKQCPPGIPETAAAYRFGGLGTHHWVIHYEFARFVLGQCWSSLQQRPDLRAAEETHRLKREGKTWLQSRHPDWKGFSPVQIMERERRRLPLILSGQDVVADDDCPLCQVMADSANPFFWHFDGCEMEDEFVFSSSVTREQWDEEQERSERLQREFDASWAARKSATNQETATAAYAWHGDNGASDDGVDEGPLPLERMLFQIGAQLAELDSVLKQDADTLHFVETLNRDFGNLRETTTSTLTLVEPVMERFCDDLEEVHEHCPDLATHCSGLRDTLRDFAQRMMRPAP